GRAPRARARGRGLPRHRRGDPLLVVLRRERRALRDDPRRRGRGDLRRAEPRVDHRRRAALQGAAAPLPPRRHGRPARAALGGALGGFTAGRREIVDLLRQRSRPYLFSNALAPMIVAASRAVLGLLGSTTELRDRLERNTLRFREGIAAAGFAIRPGVTPI